MVQHVLLMMGAAPLLALGPPPHLWLSPPLSGRRAVVRWQRRQPQVRLAGVIMWVPAGVVYLGAVLALNGVRLAQMERRGSSQPVQRDSPPWQPAQARG